MRKILKICGISALILVTLWLIFVAVDRQTLSRDILRLHVVAASDSPADQAVKLEVRDAVTAYLQPKLSAAADADQAAAMLQASLEELTLLARQTLEAQGFSGEVTVTLEEEAFPVRHYDTFSLPSGVYRALRVTIGPGQGQNWWCVVFPGLCTAAAGEDLTDTTAGAGFSDGLSGALTGETTYQLRFYFLDLMGKVQNFFRQFA